MIKLHKVEKVAKNSKFSAGRIVCYFDDKKFDIHIVQGAANVLDN